MPAIELLPPNVPESEFSLKFVIRMANRMAMSFFKYGRLELAFPTKIDSISTAKAYISNYELTGNIDRLVDASNYLMIEFMRPRHKDAHDEPSDSSGSLGRQWHGEIDPSKRRNDEI